MGELIRGSNFFAVLPRREVFVREARGTADSGGVRYDDIGAFEELEQVGVRKLGEGERNDFVCFVEEDVVLQLVGVVSDGDISFPVLRIC